MVYAVYYVEWAVYHKLIGTATIYFQKQVELT